MPRKTKDNQLENSKIVVPKKATKKVVSKGSTTKKSVEKTVSKSPARKVDAKSTTTKKTTKSTTKKEPTKKTTTKKSAIKKESVTKNAKKNTVAKKATTKKVAAKKDIPLKETKKTTRKKKNTFVEYYDLPVHYEQTIVKILAQTPTILFVYWNISDKDIKKLLKQYGENFFYETSPFLVVINKTKNYQFEVEINDYANSWYLHIPDSDCEYEVVLTRKSKNHTFSISSSNQLETPNDHILFEKLGKTIFFQNVKTQNVEEKNIFSFGFMNNIGRIYNIYDLYKEIYKDELNGDELGIRLSSSQFSSTFK